MDLPRFLVKFRPTAGPIHGVPIAFFLRSSIGPATIVRRSCWL
jgi:hypothetical protein